MCVKRLLVPRYPAVAQSARLSIDISAAITLSSDGKVESVVIADASDSRPTIKDIFLLTIEQSIRSSEFEPACAQKTVRIIYSFRMDAAPDVTASWFGYPNRIEVWAVTPRL